MIWTMLIYSLKRQILVINEALLYVFAVINITIKGISPTMRLVSRSLRVAFG